jgi:hypothetical protein
MAHVEFPVLVFVIRCVAKTGMISVACRHNSEVQGYEPWSPMVGFERANIPVSNDGTSNMRLMR